MKTTYINATDAREKFFDLIEDSQKQIQPVHITVRGVPKAVIMSQEDYEGWTATLETLSDKSLIADIVDGLQDIKKGHLVSLSTLKGRLAKQRVSA